MQKKATISTLIVLAFFLFMYSGLIAQAPFFKNIPFDKEKKGAILTKLFQGSNGYIWVGTNLGISRFDGQGFKSPDNDSGIVTAIAENNDAVLWVGHNNGRIDYIDNLKLKNFSSGKSIPNVEITDILFDPFNRLWFSTNGAGVFCFENNELYNLKEAEGLTNNFVHDLLLTNDGRVWAATEKGISICNLKNGKWGIENISEKNGLPGNNVRILSNDGNGKIWIGMKDEGVCFYDINSAIIKIPYESHNWKYGQVNDILPMKSEILIGTEEHGIIEIHFGLPSLHKMVPASSTEFNSVKWLMKDNSNQVWVCADNRLKLTNSNLFQTIEIPLEWHDAVKAIASDNTGKIWFANRKGIFSKDNSNTAIRRSDSFKNLDFSSVICLYVDLYNTLWIGTRNSGLYNFDPISKSILHYTTANGLEANQIYSITGVNNELWLATSGGASKMDITNEPPVFKNFTYKGAFANSSFFQISIDRNKAKWFGIDGKGLYRFDSSGLHHYKILPGLVAGKAYATTHDIYGNTWVAAMNSGLFRLNGRGIKRYTVLNGLHDNEILNLTSDDKGNLLISHADGLEIFNIKKEYFNFYGIESGIENIHPLINASCKTQNGEILIGSSDRIIRYTPDDSRDLLLPKLVLNDVLVFLNSKGLLDNPAFNYDQNYLSFDFAGLWYINPELISYQYLLEGYNKHWVNTRDHLVTFPSLQPGKYRFVVRTSINNDFRYSPVMRYSFTILKPFWKTNWFILGALLLSGLLLYYFLRLRIRIVRFEQEKERDKLTGQLNILKNQLNPHFLFNSFNTLLNIINKDKTMALEFTEKLSDFYREIMLVQDKESVEVSVELNLLKNYIYLQQKRFGENIRLDLNISAIHMKALIPPLTLQLLAENALKHNSISQVSPLTIKIESVQSYLVVSNNILPLSHVEHSTGIGLKNIRQRVKMLTGKEVKVIQNETEFNVIIPI